MKRSIEDSEIEITFILRPEATPIKQYLYVKTFQFTSVAGSKGSYLSVDRTKIELPTSIFEF